MGNRPQDLSANLFHGATFNGLFFLTATVAFIMWEFAGCSCKPDVPPPAGFKADAPTSATAKASVFVILIDGEL
jgi:hypothetical protein